MNPLIKFGFVGASALVSLTATASQIPPEVAVSGERHVATVHAEGAQVYQCAADATGKLVWHFREPIATLLVDGKTIGRHYAGPNWELADGSAVAAKVAGKAASATPRDIPLLKLEVTAQRGAGRLAGVSTIQRLNTRGGVAEGQCDVPGAFMSVPYSADYAFYSKGG